MGNYSDINRPRCRFPAFDDDEGVKLKRENKRNLFADDDWLITKNNETSVTSNGYHEKNREPIFSETAKQSRRIRRSRKATAEKQGHTIEQQEELKKHRKNLPDYGKKSQPETNLAGKTALFGSSHRRSTYKVKATREAKPEDSLKRQYSGRSYFVPKYIPASLIQNEPTEEFTDQRLLAAMKKTQDSYLTFDQETAAYQTKNPSDATVKKFFVPESADPPLTTMSVAPEEKKRTILERSLQGLIEDGAKEDEKKGYFN